MRLIIVTGMSGAGKSTALKMLEDMGYFCVDNLPLPLVDKFVSLALGQTQEYDKMALGLDVRSIRTERDVSTLLSFLDNEAYEVFFLEASDTTLVKRYKETRRSHPLSRQGRIDDGIALERELLKPLKNRAGCIIDTSRMLTRELRSELEKVVLQQKERKSLSISVISFGFKYGIPTDADLVFDVRFLPNPYYVDELRTLTGNDLPVQDYCMQGSAGKEFEKRWFDLIDFLIPNYEAEGKTQLVIGVGCTGGKHRSVAMANHLYQHLSGLEGYGVLMEHRDIGR